MAQATFIVRMDNALKKQFDALCADFDINASTAINVFARAVVRERRIPLEVSSGASPAITRKGALQAFQHLRDSVRANNLQDMTLDEITVEIRLARIGHS